MQTKNGTVWKRNSCKKSNAGTWTCAYTTSGRAPVINVAEIWTELLNSLRLALLDYLLRQKCQFLYEQLQQKTVIVSKKIQSIHFHSENGLEYMDLGNLFYKWRSWWEMIQQNPTTVLAARVRQVKVRHKNKENFF